MEAILKNAKEITEDYIQIRKSDFGLVQRKYKLSPTEIELCGIELIKQNIAVEIGQYLLSQGLLNFEQDGNILIADLYVVKPPKGDNK